MQEKLFYNATIITLDQKIPRARGLLVSGDTIGELYTREQQWESLPASVERIDLEGKTVVPGFNDNHLHTISLGEHLNAPDLSGLNREQILERVKPLYQEAGPGEPVIAYRWDYKDCPEPHRDILDKAFPDKPVVLVQFSGHALWLNSQALNLIGISRSSGDKSGRTVLRDKQGEPTGIVREMSLNDFMAWYFKRINRNRSLAQRYIHYSLAEFRKYGITSVQDNTWFFRTIGTLNRMCRAKELTCRFSCWSYGERPFTARLFEFRPTCTPWVTQGVRKHFLDGTFSARSAWLTEPYAGEPDNYGSGRPAEEIIPILEKAARQKKQAAFHAIGDRAVKEFLDAVEQVEKRHPGVIDLRLRLEHTQLVRKEDMGRLRDLGILVAAQPSAMEDPQKDRKLLGEERALRAYPYRSLLDEGVRLSFGSDVPGERTLNPLLSIHFAVNRAGTEAITAEEAITCYTAGSSYAEFKEEYKGSLCPGNLADFILLSDDPTAVPGLRIKDIQVEMTVVGGEIVYRLVR
jgi:predicted amidohydrolase YtcJ